MLQNTRHDGDAAFGKLVRFLSGYKVLLFPEEEDASAWERYSRMPAATEEAFSDNDDEDQYGLYTVMSQASLRKRNRPPLRSVLAGPWRGIKEGSPEVIGWRGSDDSEVGHTKELLHTSCSGTEPGIYVATLIVFVFFQFAVIYAKNLGMLLAFRFLTGFLGSPVLATGGASIGDMWSPKIRDYMIAIWASFAIAAPVLGPLVGGFAASAKGWTWTIWELLWVSGFALVLVFFFLPETFAPNILSRRARRIRRITGNQRYASKAEIEIAQVAPRDVVFEAIVRPFALCFLEPIVLLMNLYIALIYGILYIWFEAFPIVFGEKHGFNPGETGLAFLGIMIGAVFIALPAYVYWKYRWQSHQIDQNGYISPEEHLPPACLGAVCLPISLFWFGWTGNFASVHWIVPVIASMLFSFGGYLIFNSIFCYEANAYPKYATSVLAGNDFLRSSFGGAFPLFATQMFHNLGVGWACTLLGCLTVVFTPCPFLLYAFGQRIRMRSKYAQHGK
ncbi:hypothetical protein ASPACDRAFT_32923 [Aspergillus aculeatus ATCC 16872]|uniref:Major facilitator superfamily (MFS) profile domain-containing protein n=1 Tax=Aspergillus aculeatus (strain ATCC 16872 / CBS 172.66 / WB 5094) TaxID=690307 RepID=A0A1L9WLT5_ASPA1|nr:uncharacterized protein ASPACDRAFT_32923 [Aspergillus aculeatus ATCC 16872]OJJ97126.1 hypothetical protein ASPACDRAFT_32923 [Aspergillus aculeatus ATCC 16872]